MDSTMDQVYTVLLVDPPLANIDLNYTCSHRPHLYANNYLEQLMEEEKYQMVLHQELKRCQYRYLVHLDQN